VTAGETDRFDGEMGGETMTSAQFHRERLERSELAQRRSLETFKARQSARARAFAYLEEHREKVWVIDPELVVRAEESPWAR
jgi:hypothetical protein